MSFFHCPFPRRLVSQVKVPVLSLNPVFDNTGVGGNLLLIYWSGRIGGGLATFGIQLLRVSKVLCPTEVDDDDGYRPGCGDQYIAVPYLKIIHISL